MNKNTESVVEFRERYLLNYRSKVEVVEFLNQEMLKNDAMSVDQFKAFLDWED